MINPSLSLRINIKYKNLDSYFSFIFSTGTLRSCCAFRYTQSLNDFEFRLHMNIKTLRIVGLLEGISFLLLLFIAMPMKYLMGNPILVKYVGMGHGVLFIAFLVVLFVVCEKQKWSLSVFLMGLIASILPFGPFIFDRKLK